MWLHVIDVPPLPNLPDVYVISGRVGLMAALQRALAQRAGYDLELVTTTAERAVVVVTFPDGRRKPPVEVTIQQAERAGWTKRSRSNPDQPSNYELIPDRMLAARACTKALDLYAPGVRRGIAAAGAPVAPLEADSPGESALSGGPGSPQTAGPPPTPRPSGCETALDQPAAAATPLDTFTLEDLSDRIAGLPEPARADLRARWMELEIPKLRSEAFARAHLALVERLIEDVLEAVPPEVIDATPEAEGIDVEHVYRYDPADAEPFE